METPANHAMGCPFVHEFPGRSDPSCWVQRIGCGHKRPSHSIRTGSPSEMGRGASGFAANEARRTTPGGASAGSVDTGGVDVSTGLRGGNVVGSDPAGSNALQDNMKVASAMVKNAVMPLV